MLDFQGNIKGYNLDAALQIIGRLDVATLVNA